MKIEIISGSSWLECLFFMSCSSWQNASLFYRTRNNRLICGFSVHTGNTQWVSVNVWLQKWHYKSVWLTFALAKMKSFLWLLSFSFSKTIPSLFWTRWDLISCRTTNTHTSHFCSTLKGPYSTLQPFTANNLRITPSSSPTHSCREWTCSSPPVRPSFSSSPPVFLLPHPHSASTSDSSRSSSGQPDTRPVSPDTTTHTWGKTHKRWWDSTVK